MHTYNTIYKSDAALDILDILTSLCIQIGKEHIFSAINVQLQYAPFILIKQPGLIRSDMIKTVCFLEI